MTKRSAIIPFRMLVSLSSSSPLPSLWSLTSWFCILFVYNYVCNDVKILVVHAQGCISDIQEIYDREESIVDTFGTTRPRRYIICASTIFHIGDLDFNYNLRIPKQQSSKNDDDGDDPDEAIITAVSPPIPLRPNMNIRCGDDGSKINNCLITGGHIQIDGTSTRGITEPNLNNILIEGFTFVGATKSSIIVDKPGNIVFRDCEWKNFTHTSIVPIMMDYYDSMNPSTELVMTMKDCFFRDNRYFGNEAYSALIYGNSNQNRLIIEKTIFENNNMIWNNTKTDTNSFLIETLGPTCIDRSCFVNNLVGSSDIAVFGSSLVSSHAHISNSSGNICNFASSFENLQQFKSFKPLCIEAVEDKCNFELSNAAKAEPCVVNPAPTSLPTIRVIPSSTTAPSTNKAPSLPPTVGIAPSIAPAVAPVDRTKILTERPTNFFPLPAPLTEKPTNKPTGSTTIATTTSLTSAPSAIAEPPPPWTYPASTKVPTTSTTSVPSLCKVGFWPCP